MRPSCASQLNYVNTCPCKCLMRQTPRNAVRQQIRQQGAALPIVLLISAMMLTTSAAWFEATLTATRSGANLRDALQAFHAADSALTLCSRSLLAGAAQAASNSTVEPVGWKLEPTFTASAVTPVAQWPGSASPPQCLIEGWHLVARPDARAYLLTARGFGHTRDSQAWLQLELVIDGGKIERHWRRVAARPF
jgi:hypothetical protein